MWKEDVEMNILQKTIKHLKLVSKHKWIVFKLSIKAGIPFRGVMHDLSKFTPVEFFESVKYYDGKKSPLHVAREDIGYSKAWLHHKSRNKHHFEYWEDISKKERIGVYPPYKYLVEAVCDKLSAGIVYEGESWTKEQPYKYWIDKEKPTPIARHPGTIEFIETVFKKIAEDGIDETINPKYLKNLYEEISKKYNIKKYKL